MCKIVGFDIFKGMLKKSKMYRIIWNDWFRNWIWLGVLIIIKV